MKQLFQNMKMRTKIIVITLIISVITTSIGLYIGYLFNVNYYRTNVVETLVEDVQLISNYLVMPMEFESPAKGKEVLEKLRSKSKVLNCQVFLPDNSLFTSIDFGQEEVGRLSPLLKEKEVVIDNKYIEIYKPINYLNQYYGGIYIRAENNILHFQKRYLLIACLLSFIMGIMAFVMAHFGQKPIVRPINILNKMMGKVTDEKDYSLRLSVEGKNEIAQLNKEFNQMLDAIQLNEQERDKALSALKANQDELIKAKEKAEESDRLKSVFLQNMSHEIRTPMNAIVGFSDLLNNTSLSFEKKELYLNIIQTNSHQLLSIVNDILTISAIETKQESLNLEKIELNSFLDELWTVFNNNKKLKNVNLEIEKTLIDKEAHIYSDKTKLTQILNNLLGNALKFTSEGSVRLGYTRKTENDQTFLEFFVKDTGIGIEDADQKLIFERFTQANESIRSKFGGTGLGLNICKGFIEILNGKIWLESEEGKGTEFYFTIPYKPVTSDEKKTDISEIIAPKIAIDKALDDELKNNDALVLVAEDEEYNFHLIESVLHSIGIRLIHAKDGKETIDMFKTNPNIKLILMDIKMPEMNGYQAAKIIKNLQTDMPIVAQSAYVLEKEIKHYSKVFDDYITKPINSTILTEMVNKYLYT